ncbi:MAG TPA: hypothetical protein VGH80_04675 [Xanthomonadaceae bacterium]|jgi:tetratricopeptide (TPR) repeat protein
MPIRPFRPRVLVALLSFLLLALPACNRSSGPGSTATSGGAATAADATEAALREAFVLTASGKTSEAAAAFDRAIASEGFAQIPEAHRYTSLQMAGETHEALHDPAKAHALFVRSSESSEAESRAWNFRLRSADETGDSADGMHCMTVIAQHWPGDLEQVPGQMIWRIQTSLGEGAEADALRFDLFDALYKAHWKDKEMNPSPAWRELARILLVRADLARARQVAASVDDTRVALSMRVDKRFDAITKDNPAFDIDRLAAANLDKARAEAARDPESLFARTRLISSLMDLTRYDEALRVADDTIAMTANGSGPKRFRDFNEHYNWILNGRERALFRLGRVDEAVSELERAARAPEYGGVNVSQAINLAELYIELGRANDALATVAKVGDRISPFGRMQMEFVKLWAAVQLHDAKAVDQHMDYLRAHRADSKETWADALALDGKDDEAAGELIDQLRSEYWRSKALEDLQYYAEIRRLPREATLIEQWRRIEARADVREAIAKVGRVETFRIDPSPF